MILLEETKNKTKQQNPQHLNISTREGMKMITTNILGYLRCDFILFKTVHLLVSSHLGILHVITIPIVCGSCTEAHGYLGSVSQVSNSFTH